MKSLPPLPAIAEWVETRDALHAYSKVLGAIRESALPPHPRWWHVSLHLDGGRLTTGELPNPAADEAVVLTLDPADGRVEARAAGTLVVGIDLSRGPSATELGAELLGHLRGRAMTVEPAAERWQNGEPRRIEPVAARRWVDAVTAVAGQFEEVRGESPRDASPVQLWPHHFDLSCELFGDRRVPDGEGGEAASQIGFGFSTGDSTHGDAYFYANPWPFDERLTGTDLPGTARWVEAPWQGSLMPYGGASAADLRTYLSAVVDAADPYL